MPTNAPPAYASPQTSGAVRRSQYLADAIRQMHEQPKDVFNTATGTNLNILSNAILGFSQNDADAKADAALAADKTRVADLIRSSFPDQRGLEAQQLNSGQTFDLTPGANEQRKQQGGIGNLASMIFETTGDPAAALNAGLGQQRQAIEDERYKDEQQYARGRDARGDFVADRGFNYQQDRDQVGDSQWGQQFDFTRGRADVADKHWGAEFGESKRQFDAKLAADREAEAAKAANKGAGAVFDGPQLATIYNKNMDALDAARTAQGDLDTIASTAQQFLDVVGDDNWIQGNNIISDMMQAGSFKTTELKALTDRIAPIMRKPGSGSSSDRDVEMFKNSVVNVNNTPEANRRFAEGAVAIADRNRKYIDFLNEMIDPTDPQSRQKADRIWSLYKNDQRLFDDKTGALNRAAQPFDVWFAENAGDAPPTAAAPQDDVSDLLEKYR